MNPQKHATVNFKPFQTHSLKLKFITLGGEVYNRSSSFTVEERAQSEFDLRVHFFCIQWNLSIAATVGIAFWLLYGGGCCLGMKPFKKSHQLLFVQRLYMQVHIVN